MINEKIEEVLIEILPTAFAVVKDTARRFVENENVEVTASEFDRDLASTRESIIIKGERQFGKTDGLQVVLKLSGIWFITMFS